MAGGDNTIKCKSCTRVLAAVTADGLTPVQAPEEFGCSTCQRFGTLYDALQAADIEWAAFENKRDSITKSFARDNHKKARMEFDNWLMTVEALPVPPTGERTTRIEQASPEVQHVFHGSEQPHLGIARRRSHSPTTQPPVTDEESPNPRPQQCDAPLSFRPSPKRSRSTNSLLGRKRLKFSDTVEFHKTYRSSDQYHRPSQLYVRGRNAPPEGSEYMDTSGSGQTFLRFTQMKKVGAKWVELSEEDLAKKSKSPALAVAQQAPAAVEQLKSHSRNEDVAGKLEQEGEAPPDARAARLARRAEASSMDSAQTKSTSGTRNRGNRMARKVKAPLPDDTSSGVQESLIQPTLSLSTSTVQGMRADDTDNGLSATNDVGQCDEERGERTSIATIEKANIGRMRNDEIRSPEPSNNELHLEVQHSGTAGDRYESIERDIKVMQSGLHSAIITQNHSAKANESATKSSCIN